MMSRELMLVTGSFHCPGTGQCHHALPQQPSLLASTLALSSIIRHVTSRSFGFRRKRRYWQPLHLHHRQHQDPAVSTNSNALLAFASCRSGIPPIKKSTYSSFPHEIMGNLRHNNINKLHYSANSDYNNRESKSNSGEYVELGSISLDASSSSTTEIKGDEIMQYQLDQFELDTSTTHDTTNVEEWRSKHWIVLIDDEPAIRLAIGDYLHSMGYSVITACDGPMAFLEALLWSCSWFITSKEQGRMEDEEEVRVQEPPPWNVDGDDNDKHQLSWRLPDCIISDIRMPGGIDGVELLELLRRLPSPPDTAAEKNAGNNDVTSQRRKRGRPKKDDTASIYDDKDDFELLDSIVAGDKGMDQNERITTPADQAMQHLDAIRACIDYYSDLVQSTEEGQEQCQQQYPSSVQQIPIILLTAKAMVSDRIVGYKAGANGYLPKPFRPEELLGMIDNLMRKQHRERQNLIHTRTHGTETNNSNDNGIPGLTPEEAKDITKELVQIKKILQAKIKQQEPANERMDREHLQSLLPEAMWMLRTGERRKKVFTKDHMRSILAHCFGKYFPQNNTMRNVLLSELEKLSAIDPEKLDVMVHEQNQL